MYTYQDKHCQQLSIQKVHIHTCRMYSVLATTIYEWFQPLPNFLLVDVFVESQDHVVRVKEQNWDDNCQDYGQDRVDYVRSSFKEYFELITHSKGIDVQQNCYTHVEVILDQKFQATFFDFFAGILDVEFDTYKSNVMVVWIACCNKIDAAESIDPE